MPAMPEIEPSPLALRIRERLREAHAGCPGCALAQLWAEDVQTILDLAGVSS